MVAAATLDSKTKGAALVVAFALALAPLPSAAFSPAQVCNFDPRRVAFEKGEVSTNMPGTWPVWTVAKVGEGFVVSHPDGGYSPGETGVFVLIQHCPSGEEVALRLPGGEKAEHAENEVHEMIFGPNPFTLTQFAARVEDLGGWSRLSNGRIGSCACDVAAQEAR